MLLRTIDECDTRLAQIDREVQRLELERRHVTETRDLLVKFGEPEETADPGRPMPALQAKIYEIIRENPGLNSRQIRSFMVQDPGAAKVTKRLSYMTEKNYVRNLGGTGLSGKWYIVEGD